MMRKYGLEDNEWLMCMFLLKQKWALAYGQHMFCVDMITMQRNESMNSLLKRYVSYKHKFFEFFKHFQRLLDDRRYEELKADFKSITSVPSLAYLLRSYMKQVIFIISRYSSVLKGNGSCLTIAL